MELSHLLPDLSTAEGREQALDVLGQWFVEAILGADDDSEAIRAVMATAIKTFYDIREAADQPRGMYAGHFFMVDAIGLDDSDRPVPWRVLAQHVSPARLERCHSLFNAVERTTD